MPQHFAAIGFDVSTPRRLKKLAREAIERGIALKNKRPGLPDGAFVWELGRGLEVWVIAEQIGANGEPDWEIIACYPAFLPEDSLHLRAYRLLRNDKSPGEVILRGRLQAGAELAALLVDWPEHGELPQKGLDLDARLSGLAVGAELWALDEAPPSVMQIEDESGKPVAVETLFLPLDRDCHYLIQGDIAGVRDLSNFHTGEKLVALGVTTAELALSLIAPRSLFARMPLVGDRLRATVWLQAHLKG